MLLTNETKLREAIQSIIFDRIAMKEDPHIEGLSTDEMKLLIQSTCADDLAMSGSLHGSDFLEDLDMPLLNYQITTESISLKEYSNKMNQAISNYYHRYVIQQFEDFLEVEYVVPIDGGIH